jgi:hypothetical protein
MKYLLSLEVHRRLDSIVHLPCWIAVICDHVLEDVHTIRGEVIRKDDWEEFRTEGGDPYWYNRNTEQSQWESPFVDSSAVTAAEQVRENGQTGKHPTELSRTSAEASATRINEHFPLNASGLSPLHVAASKGLAQAITLLVSTTAVHVNTNEPVYRRKQESASISETLGEPQLCTPHVVSLTLSKGYCV